MMFFKNHFGMVVSVIISLILSICVTVTAIFWDQLTFSIELLIRNCGSAFLTVMLISVILPVNVWGSSLASALKLKPRTLPFRLVCNLIPTLFFNTGATLVLVGVNVGFTAPHYWTAVLHDYFVMFGVAYIVSLFAEAFAVKVAVKCCVPFGEHHV